MKTESNIRPASQFEIEALPPIEGRSCTVILYDNIQGPFTRQASGEDQPEPCRESRMHTAMETCTQPWTTLRRSSTNKRTF